MAKKPTVTTISSGYASNTQLNNNFTALRNAFDNTLSRDGSTPNYMEADLDLNSNDLLNAKEVRTEYLYINGQLVSTGGVSSAGPADVTVDRFTGDGTTTSFTLTRAPLGKSATFVFVDGVSQEENTYSLSSTSLLFTEAPPLYSHIEVRAFSSQELDLSDSSSLYRDLLSGDGSTTEFTLDATPVGQNNSFVFISGVYQQKTTYTLVGNTLTFSSAPPSGTNNIEVMSIATTPLGSTTADLVTYNQGSVGSVSRTVENKLQETVSVKDFGAVGDGGTDDTAAFVSAAAAVGEGGTVFCPSGIYSLTTINCLPVSFVGEGAGSTVFKFDNTSPGDGFVFEAPTQLNVQFGAENATVQTRNGHGASAFNLPKGVSLNDFRAMPTFRNLAFRGENVSGFAQDYSWEWMFNLGDAWSLVIEHIDACGSFRPENNPAGQFVDGFMRTNPSQGILTAWVSNITTHNVARFWEIRQKTYLRLHNIDVARSQKGIYDAPDRVFEPNPYAYGESHWTSVIINSSEVGVDLRYRYSTNADGLVIQRAGDAFDFGGDWIGLHLKQSRNCVVNGLSLGAGGTLVNDKIGYILDGCEAVTFNGVNFGTLDFCARVGVSGSAFGATQSHQVANFATFANVGTVLDVQNARSFKAVNFAKSSGVTISTFASYADAVSRAGTFILNAPTDNALEFVDDFFWVDASAALNEKRWRWTNAGGDLVLATQNDNLSAGQNALLLKRTGGVVGEIEIRSAQIYANGALQLQDTGSQVAPSTVGGKAQLYIDPADGNFKIIFGSGTIKTIATDP